MTEKTINYIIFTKLKIGSAVAEGNLQNPD